MKAIVKFVKQDLKNRVALLKQSIKAKRERRSTQDDSVEAQAETFRTWMWSSAAGLSILLIAAVVSMKRSEVDPTTNPEKAQVGSMLDQLPDGYMIAPIEPTNIDSLDSIFESHGYADLYRTTSEGSKGRRIARGLALIRAPRNPRQFAVIVSEAEIDVLGQLNEPVMVVLRKKPVRNSSGTIPNLRDRKNPKPLRALPVRTIDLIEEDGTETDGGVS